MVPPSDATPRQSLLWSELNYFWASIDMNYKARMPKNLALLEGDFESCIYSIRETACKYWSQPILDHFTDHGISHSERIINLQNDLLEGTTINLNQKERFILLAADFLHDIGMQFPKYAELEYKKEYTFEEKGKVRENHNKTSAKLIEESVSENPPIKLGFELCRDYAHYIAIVSEYHRDLDLNQLSDKANGSIRLPLLAAILRLCDELDADFSRVKMEVLKLKDIPTESKFHWWLHHYVENISIKNSIIEVSFRIPEVYKKTLIEKVIKQKVISSIKYQLAEVLRLLFDYDLRLLPDVDSDVEYYPSGLELLPDDLKEYIEKFFSKMDECPRKLTQNTGLIWYADGLAYSDDLKVKICLNKIMTLISEDKIDAAINEIELCRSLFMGPKDKIIFLGITGNCYYIIGKSDIAATFYDELIRISRREDIETIYKSELTQARATALNNLGIIYCDKGKRNKGLRFCEEALRIYVGLNNKDGEAYVLTSMGVIHKNMGHMDQALILHKKALHNCHEIENKNGEGTVLCNIGDILIFKGLTDRAFRMYKKALDIFIDNGNKRGIALAKGGLARICYIKGDLELAIDYLRESIEIYGHIKFREGEASLLVNMGAIYHVKGEIDDSIDCYSKAMRIFNEIQSEQGVATTLGNIGIICREKRMLDRAMEYHRRSLEICAAIGDRQGEGEQLNNIGIIYENKEDSY